MKRFLVLIMASVFFVSGMLPAESRAAEEYVLSLNLPIPPIHNRWHFALKQWAEELNKRSNGRIRVEPYFAEALSKEADAFESVKDGISDMAEFSYDVAVGQFPFHERIFTLIRPSMSLEDPTPWVLEMQNAFPEVRKELDGVKVLFSHALTVGMLIGSKEPIASLADFKGKKINVLGDYQVANKLRAFGASVVNIPMADVFMSMQQGVIDATSCDYDLLVSRRLGDVVKHVTLVNTTGLVFAVVMNKDVYDGMPEDLKQVVDSVSGEYGRSLFKTFWEKKQYESLNTWVTDMGGTLHVLSDADYAEADRLTEPVMREWIDIVTKAGLPGKDIEAKFRELEKRYAKPWSQSHSVEIAGKK